MEVLTARFSTSFDLAAIGRIAWHEINLRNAQEDPNQKIGVGSGCPGSAVPSQLNFASISFSHGWHLVRSKYVVVMDAKTTARGHCCSLAGTVKLNPKPTCLPCSFQNLLALPI